MTDFFVSGSGSNQCYFERVPEYLVLEGYRHWSAGFDTGSIQPWEMAWNLYATTLGAPNGRMAMGELSNYIRTLKKCASCPLRSFPFRSHHLCLEECLTLGLIASLQHEDDTAGLCLQHMTCPARSDEVVGAARSFADKLFELNQVLLPIPRHVIEDVTTRQLPKNYH